MSYDPQKQEALENDRQAESQESSKDSEGKPQEKKREPSGEKANQPPKNFMKRILPFGKSSRISEVKKSDLVFGVAFSAAGLKDLLDLFQATGVGYALVIIMTILIFIFIGFMILIGIFLGGGGGLHILLMLFGGAGVEILPGIGFLPATMGLVAMIYLSILKKRKQTAQKLEEAYASQ